MMHSTTWAKVNAPVDEGIAEVVELLSAIPGLQTLDSCQGDPGGRHAVAWALDDVARAYAEAIPMIDAVI